MNSIYLVRHAQSIWTPDEQRPLTPAGHQAALHVAELLSHYPGTAIYSSPSARALQTVQPLADKLHLAIHVCEDLVERNLGETPVDDFFDAVRMTWERPDEAFPGGESNIIAQKRGVSALERIAQGHPGELIVVSTHGNLLALILQYYDPAISYVFWRGLSMPDVYQLEIDMGKKVNYRRLWQES